MRIFEITSRNAMWIGFYNQQEVDQKYQSTVKMCNMLLKLKHRSKYPYAIDTINDFKNTANKILNTKFPDPDDPDIVALINKIKQMIEHLSALESQLH